MDKLIEKHRLVQIQNDSIWDMVHNNANITKEVACGFAEWIRDYYQPLAPNKKDWCSVRDKSIVVTTSELFDIYIKSL